MRTLPVYPAAAPLPLARRPAATGLLRRSHGWDFSGAQVAAFDALLHEVHPDAPRIAADHLEQLADWLLSLPETEARQVLDERLGRIEEMRAMLDDDDWDCTDADRVRARKLLAYLDQSEDLIPDGIPLLGMLDDVLLLELAWPALATEAEEYRDFCDFRRSEHPAGDGAGQRATWVRERLAELALWRHQLDARAWRYVEGGHPDRPFRVS